jgi:hypothetical protein
VLPVGNCGVKDLFMNKTKWYGIWKRPKVEFKKIFQNLPPNFEKCLATVAKLPTQCDFASLSIANIILIFIYTI